MIFLQIALFLALLAGGALVVSHLPRRLAAALWWAAPVLLMPRWLANAAIWHWSVFLWAKVLSVVCICAWNASCLVRAPSPWVLSFSLWFGVGINIVECVALDVSASGAAPAHWANAVAGVLLIIALPRLPGARIVREDGRSLIRAPLSRTWIVAYSVWNLCFVYLNWSAYAFGQHLAIHGAAFLLTWWGGFESWYMARTQTLGLAFLLYLTFFGYFSQHFDTTSWSSPLMGAVFALTSLSLALLVTAQLWRRASTDSPLPGALQG